MPCKIQCRIDHLENLVKVLTNVKQSESYSKARQFNPPTNTPCNLKKFCGRLFGNRVPYAFLYYGFSWTFSVNRATKSPLNFLSLQPVTKFSQNQGTAELIPINPSTHQLLSPPHYPYMTSLRLV